MAYRLGKDVLHAAAHLPRSNARILYHIPPRQRPEQILCDAKHASGILVERFEKWHICLLIDIKHRRNYYNMVRLHFASPVCQAILTQHPNILPRSRSSIDYFFEADLSLSVSSEMTLASVFQCSW
jgi:hypothetical protein